MRKARYFASQPSIPSCLDFVLTSLPTSAHRVSRSPSSGYTSTEDTPKCRLAARSRFEITRRIVEPYRAERIGVREVTGRTGARFTVCARARVVARQSRRCATRATPRHSSPSMHRTGSEWEAVAGESHRENNAVSGIGRDLQPRCEVRRKRGEGEVRVKRETVASRR